MVCGQIPFFHRASLPVTRSAPHGKDETVDDRFGWPGGADNNAFQGRGRLLRGRVLAGLRQDGRRYGQGGAKKQGNDDPQACDSPTHIVVNTMQC